MFQTHILLLETSLPKVEIISRLREWIQSTDPPSPTEYPCKSFPTSHLTQTISPQPLNEVARRQWLLLWYSSPPTRDLKLGLPLPLVATTLTQLLTDWNFFQCLLCPRRMHKNMLSTHSFIHSLNNYLLNAYHLPCCQMWIQVFWVLRFIQFVVLSLRKRVQKNVNTKLSNKINIYLESRNHNKS